MPRALCPAGYGPDDPRFARPRQEDEYIRDGGDEGWPAGVGKTPREAAGLGMEDTVAFYDTLDGKTIAEPSNEVRIYAPRFGAVRQVVGLMAHEERQKAGGVEFPQQIASPTTTQPVAGAKQNVQLKGEIAARPPVAMRSELKKDVLSTNLGPQSFQGTFQAYENLKIVRMGVYEMGEKALLAKGSTSAIAWSNTQAVQIVLDHQGAMAEVKYDASQSTYTVVSPPGKPKLRLVKIASTDEAKPGDMVDFTLRFDNIGNEPIGNVAILDSLNTRLEYVEGTAQCSRDAHFAARPNEGGSAVVSCDLASPLMPGEGGVFRFRCRVR
jgi:uncharacterized repeat protein (TIGR01451 family)